MHPASAVQVTPSFKALTQSQPDLAIGFVSDVAKKLGLPYRDIAAGQDQGGDQAMDPNPSTFPRPEVTSSRMDIDSHRRMSGS